MHKFIISVVFLCFNCTISFAQLTKENAAQIKNYIQTSLITSKLKSEVKQKSDADNVIKVIVSNAINSPILYDTLSRALVANHFEGTKSKMLDPINAINIKSDLSIQDFLKSYFDSLNLVLNIEQKKQLNFESERIRLQDEVIKSFISDKTTAQVQPQTLNEESQEETIPNTESKGFFSFSNFNFFTALPILLLALLLGYIINKMKEINNKNKELDGRIDRRVKKENSGTNSYGHSNQNNLSNNINDKQITNAINKSDFISELNNSISILKKKVSDMEGNSTTILQNNNSVQVTTDNLKEDVFYMMKPVDNYFLDSNKSISKAETAYKFTLHKNRIEADFEIHTTGLDVKEMIRRSESYLKSGCNEENISNANSSNVITKTKGLVALQDGKWIIKNKAFIRYE